MADSSFEKTEAPTSKRRQEARQDGNVPRSNDLTAAVALLLAIVLLYLFSRHMFSALGDLVKSTLTSAHAENPTRPTDVSAIVQYSIIQMTYAVGPIILLVMVAGTLATMGQVGFLLTGKPLQPKFNRLSPISGVKRLMDMRALMRLVMSILKISAIVVLAEFVVQSDVPRILRLAELDLRPAFAQAALIVFWLGVKLAILLLVIAIIDYSFQKWKHEQDLLMSKQEVREEMKSMDGDPLVKQRRARVARQLALQRVGQAVPNADVIVTNPTHFSIALKYDPETMRAPKVVAKGADFLAMRIRQLAIANGVPIVERKTLARALYSGVEVGQEVPPDYYNAVAEILAYVYRVGKKAG